MTSIAGAAVRKKSLAVTSREDKAELLLIRNLQEKLEGRVGDSCDGAYVGDAGG